MSATYDEFEPFASPLAGSFSMEHACRVLGVSRRTIYYWIRSGRLHTVRTRMGSQRVLAESVRAAFLARV